MSDVHDCWPYYTPGEADDDLLCLFYREEDNTFIDGEGFIVWGIFDVINPNDLYLFRHYKRNMIIPHRTIPGLDVELYYPNDDEIEDAEYEYRYY